MLIGAAGTGTAFGAITALRRHWPTGCRLVVQDTNPSHLVTASLLCDTFVKCPMSKDPGFLEHVLQLVARLGVDTYLPLLPAELSLIRLHAADFESRGVVLVLADRDSLVDVSDKWAVAQAAIEHAIPVPLTGLGCVPDGLSEVFVKPRYGVGSRGARVLAGAECEAISQTERHELIVQETCTGPEVTVDAFVTPDHGCVHALARERLEVKAGVCVKARISADEDLSALAGRIAKAFSLKGTFCFQVMRLRGVWTLTDLNPRPGAGTSMCQVVGTDFHAANFALAWGEDYSRYLSPLARPVYVTRQYADFFHGEST